MATSADPIAASCLCGAVGFHLARPVIAMGHCHCSMCQRQHGSPFSTYVQLRREQLTIDQGADLINSYQSSDEVNREFCSVCGSSLFYRHRAMPEFLWIAAGVLDDDPGVRPGHHIFVADKAAWFDIHDELPQHKAFPDEGGHG